MSYASEVKKELTGITVHEKNARAELMALIRMKVRPSPGGSIH